MPPRLFCCLLWALLWPVSPCLALDPAPPAACDESLIGQADVLTTNDDELPEPLRSITPDEFRAEAEGDEEWFSVELPLDVRKWFRNPDGSCVQCSIGMIGVDQNVPPAALLLWNSEYGRAVRGGSNPQRVSGYCTERKIRVYNVTGSPTFDFMRWACRNGRGAAIGAGRAHFQTLYGHNPARGLWAVCNNNSPQKIDIYDDAGFASLHLASGRWCVVLDYPSHPATPRYVAWWQ